MKSLLTAVCLVLAVGPALAQKAKTKKEAANSNPNKVAVIQSVEKHQAELIKLSDQVWAFAETALKETKSAQVLSDYAEAQGLYLKQQMEERTGLTEMSQLLHTFLI